MPQFERKRKLVEAVQWTGNLKVLPRLFRARKYASTGIGRLVSAGGLTVIKRGIVTSGVKIGDWLLIDQDENLEVMGDERFKAEYLPILREEKAG